MAKKPDPKPKPANPQQRTYAIADWRAEKPDFRIEQVREGESVRYVVHGDLSAPAPPIRRPPRCRSPRTSPPGTATPSR